MSKEDLEYINSKIDNASDMGYERIVEILEYIKSELLDTTYQMKDSTRELMWELVDYITIY